MRTVAMNASSLLALRTVLAGLLLAGLCCALAIGAVSLAGSGRLPAMALVVLPVAAGFAVLWRRVRSEDRVARLEVALCREQHARTQADDALAEADLLLARLTARPRAGGLDPVAQLATVHAELTQLQRQVAGGDPQLSLRLELLCLRVERAAVGLRATGRAAEPG